VAPRLGAGVAGLAASVDLERAGLTAMWLGEFESVSAALGVVSARAGVAEDSFTVRFRLRNGVDGVLDIDIRTTVDH